MSSLLGDLLVFFTSNILCFCCRKSKNKKDDQQEEETNEWNENEKKDVIKVVNDYDNEEEYDQDERFVPLIIVLLIFAGYLVLGAYIFTLLETDWSLLEASYYAFVSLSTIGKFYIL